MGKKSLCENHHDVILQLNKGGWSRQEIADRIGLTFHCVQAYLQRRNIDSVRGKGRKRLIPDSYLRNAIENRRITQKQVAQEMNVSLTCVEKSCKRLTLKTSRIGPKFGSDHPAWKGGRHAEKHGYILIYVPLHPLAKKPAGYVLEHRLVLEIVLSRYLRKGEVIDHLDNHPRHNWPDNLRLYANNADHLKATLTGRKKETPRKSIPHAYGSSQKIDRCPEQHETLAQCPSEILLKLNHHIRIHRPTNAHATISRLELLRQGAWSPPFVYTSTD